MRRSVKTIDYAHMNVFDVIRDIDEPFLMQWVPSMGDTPGTWRVLLRVGDRSFHGQNTDENMAVREVIQRYLLVYRDGHGGDEGQ